MAATSDWRLYQLYMEFGEAQDRLGRPGEAADAYALALYFSRRMNDPARIHECRQLVLARNPNHVAGQTASAPLFFAQLLMRYPADDVEMMLTAGKQHYSGPSVSVAEDEPPEPPQNVRTFRHSQSAKQSYAGFARTHHHHSEPTFEGMARASVRPVVAEDVLLADAGLLDDDLDEPRSRASVGDLPTSVKALAAGAIASGLLFVGYLGYSLYPVLHQTNGERNSAGRNDQILVTDDAGPRVDSPPPRAGLAKEPVAKAGANTPVKLSNETPPKVSVRPPSGEEPSRK